MQRISVLDLDNIDLSHNTFMPWAPVQSLGMRCVLVHGIGRVPVPLFHFPSNPHARSARPAAPQTEVPSDFIVIHAHGNATDCGGSIPFYQSLVDELNVSVLGVEYPGYGPTGFTAEHVNTLPGHSAPSSDGPHHRQQRGGGGPQVDDLEKQPVPGVRPSGRGAYTAVLAAYEYALSLGYPASRILLFGQSIGSYPTCKLAANRPVRT